MENFISQMAKSIHLSSKEEQKHLSTREKKNLQRDKSNQQTRIRQKERELESAQREEQLKRKLYDDARKEAWRSSENLEKAFKVKAEAVAYLVDIIKKGKCATGEHNCHPNATYLRSGPEGQSYKCICRRGWVGNGVFCGRPIRSVAIKEAFYSSLKMEKVEDENYKHAKRVWDKLEMQTMGQYHDVYLMLDTLLLADVFEEHRIMGIENYGLDPAHYFTSPSLAWDGLMKMTQKELELLTVYDMHLFIEKGMRGGISTVGEKRHAKANNPYKAGHGKNKRNQLHHVSRREQ